MGSQKITSKQYFRNAKTIHGTLVGGVLIFASIVILITRHENWEQGYNYDANLYFAAVGILGLWALFGGEFVFRAQIKRAKMQPALTKKMMQYQTASIIKYAIYEGVALFAIVLALLTMSVWFLYIAAVFTAILLSFYPTIDKSIKELELNAEEQRQVQTPEAYISESI